ncbi:hypothetical protein CHS0354_013985 [Potamilus streckersoni]|uniref:Transcription termination factor 3, mitochondrial n=1 Tax=Potamilus streckersoni TaxID=2493646 RepID=A0AAE0TLY8_9BIVA|nr:hypothetical protein CHS0354_013985 [Potamilus streckersoni]
MFSKHLAVYLFSRAGPLSFKNLVERRWGLFAVHRYSVASHTGNIKTEDKDESQILQPTSGENKADTLELVQNVSVTGVTGVAKIIGNHDEQKNVENISCEGKEFLKATWEDSKTVELAVTKEKEFQTRFVNSNFRTISITAELGASVKPKKLLNRHVSDSRQLTVPRVDSELTEHEQRTALPTSAYNFAAYVDHSETLSSLVKLGVDLSAIEHKGREICDFILKMDFNKNVHPYILFYRKIGVTDDELGKIITKCPYIFQQDLDNLQIRINYLESKRFTPENITEMVVRKPHILLMSTERMDAKLGFYQKKFKLTGHEVRAAIVKYPKLIVFNKDDITENKFNFHELMGFSDEQVKRIFISSPRAFTEPSSLLLARFDFLHNTMGLSHETLVQWSQIFRCRVHILEQRHRYLVSLGRAQYDPKKENYVSLHALVTNVDADWCPEIAKTSVAQFNEFLKTL